MPVTGRESAVLVPLFERAGSWHAVFTRRRADLKRHAGEISFPGGRKDPGDADAVATALREADEEIGLSPDRVEVVGALPPVPPSSPTTRSTPSSGVIAPETRVDAAARGGRRGPRVLPADVRDGYGAPPPRPPRPPVPHGHLPRRRRPDLGRDRPDRRRPARSGTNPPMTHFGLTGLATMGANLARNVASHDIPDRRPQPDGGEDAEVHGRARRRGSDHRPRVRRGVGRRARAPARADEHGQGRRPGRRGHRGDRPPPRQGRHRHRRRQLLLQGHPAPLQGAGRDRTSASWASASPAARRAR